MTEKVRVGGFVERWLMGRPRPRITGNVAVKTCTVVNRVRVDVNPAPVRRPGGRERTSSKKYRLPAFGLADGRGRVPLVHRRWSGVGAHLIALKNVSSLLLDVV